MKNAILVHGCASKEEFLSEQFPSSSNSHWLPWLQKQLAIRGIQAQTPEMPAPYEPRYEKWKRVMDRFEVTKGTFLVGHSCGAGFLLRWLGENKKEGEKLALVAPYLDEMRKRQDFLDFTVDATLQDRVGQIIVVYSTDDTVEGVKQSVDMICAALPKAKLHTFSNKGHFTLEDMEKEKFPELLKLLV
ncbi:MAG: hypothetical protein A3E07_01205 [Candidatus Wildermuthbacteria bacterium RIFCSPHIGHO2_12_FULL_45_9]|nr:MAG: hypothetical protein A2748_02245 [Candidatus Wildermuthbacteria bacterium RIFCSPHIGHO2_01_FULL_45_20]OHA70895.1 MAG: hypothetical protein A3E07_01205 [Candidatus Wildermuthbacteria bacterium RIFCSPHIGHO2_12_FULL_45_9]